MKRIKRFVAALLGLLILFTSIRFILFNPKQVEAAWYSDTWGFRVKLTIDHTKVGADQTDFPVYVNLSLLPGLFHSHVNQTDARDIRVTKSDGVTELPREVVFYNSTTDNGELHFKYTGTLSSSTDTNVYIYYGNPSASDYAVTDTYGRNNVWSNSYVSVYHLKETSGQHASSTGSNDSDSVSVNQQGANIGKIAQADDFVLNHKINVPDADALSINTTNQLTAEAWTKLDSLTSTPRVISKGGAGYTAYEWELRVGTGGDIVAQALTSAGGDYMTAAGSSGAVVTGTWYYLAVVYNFSTPRTETFKNGVSNASDTTTSGSYTNGTGPFRVGEEASGDYDVDGIIDEVRISSTARSSTWLLTQYNNQNSPSTFFTEGAEEQKRGSVLNFAFDEGYGTTAHDSSPNGYIGTLTGSPTWQPEDLCMSGKCLYYEGSTAYTSVTTSVPNVQSVSFWVKPKTNGETLVDFDGGTHYLSATGGTIAATGFDTASIYVNGVSGAPLVANAWQHVEVTTATAFTASAISIGKKTSFLNGYIDEFKIYDYARTAAQVKLDYNSRNSQSGVSVRFGPDLGNTLSNGLVGYWKMDESSGGNPSDSSGVGTTLTNVSTTAFVTGKYANAADPDGAADYFYAADNASLSITGDLTVSAWINPDTVSTGSYDIAGKWDYISSADHQSYLLRQSDDEIVMYIDSINSYVTTDAVNMTAAGGWYHVVATYKAAGTTVSVFVNGQPVSATTTGTIPTSIGDDTDRFHIGAEDSSTAANNFYNGQIDEVRVYNRTFSPAEVATLYNFAPGPVLYYPLNENTGTSTVNDISGNANTGTMTGSMTANDWIPGKFGSALDFDGSNDALTIATANDSYVDFNTTEAFSGGAWVYIKTMPGSGEQDAIITKWDATSTTRGYRLFVENDDADTTGNFQIDMYDESADQTISATGANDTVATNTWYHVSFTFNGGVAGAANDLNVYTNGVLTGGNSANASFLGLEDVSADFSVGDYDTTDAVATNTAFTGMIDDIHVYNYARTSGQIIEDMNAGHPAPGSPVGSAVAYWKFDEGALNTCLVATDDYCDSSINANGLAFSSTGGFSNDGKFGKAYNGLDDVRASRTTDAHLEFGATDDFTLSLWFKSDAAANPAAIQYLVNDGAAAGSAGYAIYANTDGTICFGIDDDTAWGPDVASCNTTDIYDNTWHHIVAIRNVSLDTTYLYVDGVQKDSDNDTTTATLDSSPTFYLGDENATDGTDEFLGDLDEVKIYRLALTADQVKVEYNRGSQALMGALSTNATGTPSHSANDEYCPPGQGSTCTPPIGHWKLDEGSWTNDCSTTTVFDVSTSGYSGTACPSSTGPKGHDIGKLGSSGNFDGVNDYVDIGDSFYSDTLTIEAWVNVRAVDTVTYKDIINKRNSSGVTGGTNEFDLIIDTNRTLSWQTWATGGAGITNLNSVSALTLNQWYHIAVTHGGNGNTAYLYINGIRDNSQSISAALANTTSRLQFAARSGDNDSRYFNGFIDDVRVYNYARTPAQIAWDYNHGGPTGWWKLDENTGTAANDSMGNSTAGTLTNTPTWAVGKLNSAVSFAGSNQQILIADDPDFDFADDEDMTVTTWFKHSAASAQEVILSKYAAAGYKIIMESDGDITCGLDYDATWTPTDSVTSTLATYDNNSWHFIACVKTGATSLDLYIDGAFIGTHSVTATNTLTNADPLYLGIDADGTSLDFTGSLDDVRIYRYPLTAQQIKTVMNEGSAVRFGP